MAPKRRDKDKLCDWMQCSLCDKLISSQDAESHTVSCNVDHGFIQGNVLHGKIFKVEKYLNEDGSSITQNIREKNSLVWLAIPTMQVCGLSIGQPCIVNGVLIKRAWPHKLLQLSCIALSAQSMDEIGAKDEDIITVERFTPNERIVQSAVLQFREQDDLFDKPEFLLFAASYLDGKYMRDGSPVLLKYFGRPVLCYVKGLVWDLPTPRDERTLQKHISTPSRCSQASPNIQSRTPQSQTHNRNTVCDTLEMPKHTSDVRVGCMLGSQSPDISDSFSELDISFLPDSQTTPNKNAFPNLLTPVIVSQEPVYYDSFPSDAFARVSSKLTVLSTLPAINVECSNQRENQISLADVGGLRSQINELKTRILRALQPGCKSRCILLHGPTGTGKSLLVMALTPELGIHTIHIAGTDIWSKLFGEAESNLHKIFKSAQEKAPSIIVIDDIDVVCPKRSHNSAMQQEKRIVATLLSLLDGVTANKPSQAVVVIGISNNKDHIDAALRRAGRFGCEIEVGVPTSAQRQEILSILLNKVAHNLTEEEIKTVARNAHGYVGADLCALINEACMHSLNRQTLSSPSVNLIFQDVIHAGLVVKPSAMREVQLEVPEVRWTDIGGMSEVKMRLREAVELPLSNPEDFKRLGIQAPRGLLLYGPPGCSKTMVARALATECKINFLAVKGPEIFNQYVGESEKAIRDIFNKARCAAPSIIFFDEIDAIAAKRGSSGAGSGVEDRVLTQLLTEMDGLEFLKDVFIIAATNRPDKIDRALLRPGRFDSLIYVPLPNEDTRREILQKKINRMSVDSDTCIDSLVEATDKYSGAEIIQVCQEAALCALREDFSAPGVHAKHFVTALDKVKPHIDPELVHIYTKFSTSRIK